jgi:hypothetical protein
MRALDACLLRTLRLRPGTFILLLPLLESHHRRLAYSATGAAHTQKAREGINDGAEPNNVFVQLFLPIADFLTDRHSRPCCDCGPQVRPLLPFPPLDFVWVHGRLLLDIAPGFQPPARPSPGRSPVQGSGRTFPSSHTRRTGCRDQTGPGSPHGFATSAGSTWTSLLGRQRKSRSKPEASRCPGAKTLIR